MPKNRYAPVCLVAVGLLAGVLPAFASVVPADRSTTWNPGIPGGIPTRTTVCATVAPGGNIQAALDACPAGQVVQLAAGTFNIASHLSINKAITLRGQGPTLTKLKMPVGTNDNVITIGTQWPAYTATVNLATSAVKGTSSVTLASNPGLAVGELVTIDQLTDANLTKWGYTNCQSSTDPCRGWFTRMNRPIGQVLEVASVSGTTVTFTTPFHIDFKTSSTAQLSRFTTPVLKSAGVEDLYVSGGSNGQGNIWLSLASYSWIKNIESDLSEGSSVSISAAFRSVVRDSYVHSTQNPTPGGGGYGISFSSYSSDNLVENNAVWNFNKVMVMRASGGGNVVGYNYFEDGWIKGTEGWVETGANGSHMTTPHFELFEGNEAFNFDGDNTWGNSIYITVFRNHLTGQRRSISPLKLSDDQNVRAIGLMEGHWWYTFVGNVLGNPGTGIRTYEITTPWDGTSMWRLGYNPEAWNNPADPKVLSTVLRGGNYDYATNSVHWESVAQQTLPDSLYLTAKPAFFGNNPWPWVDPTGQPQLYTLPARARFDNPGATQTSTLGIGDVSVTEGNSGTTLANFTVSLSPAATSTVTVNYATANGTATAGSDYVAQSGTLTFTAGQTSKTIAVVVNGDTTPEPDETFTVNLSGATGATIADAQGTGTILNDDTLPTLAINSVSLNEGNSGTTPFTFTVTLSSASPSPVTVTYATANGTATAGSDYAATGGTLTFPAGSTTQTLTVLVNGDTTPEPNETFFVNLSGASGATLAGAQGTGTILNDDGVAPPPPSSLTIADVSVTEGNSGTTPANFLVTLQPASASTVTVSYTTADNTATAGSDYVAQSGTLTFAPGQTSKTITVLVNGDTTVEPDESFVVNLSGATGATLASAQAIGTILNDDSAPSSTIPGLVAGYRFAEGVGSVTADLTGNGNTGTLMGLPLWTTGEYGGALNFTGRNYVNLGNAPQLRLTGSMTLSGWIRIGTNPSDDGAIVAKLGGAGWQLKTSPDTGVRTAAIQISSNGSNSIQRYSKTVLQINTWYHIAGVYDAAARTLSIYVNGVLDNGVLSGKVPASQADSKENVNIAQRTGYPGLYNFLGKLDEVHVYNRALSAAEIATDMSTPRMGP